MNVTILTVTEAQRDDLIAAIEAADLCCPEQVADAVLASESYAAALAELERAKANDASERRALGIDA